MCKVVIIGKTKAELTKRYSLGGIKINVPIFCFTLKRELTLVHLNKT